MSDVLSNVLSSSSLDDISQLGELDWSEAQTQARAAWYYYIGGLTQQEIADLLGITRLRVNRIVGQARIDGLVHIDIKLPLASCVALEQQLKRQYSLTEVSIVPSVPNYETQTQVVGEAAGVLLQTKLRDGIGLGVSWGRSLRSAVRRLKPNRYEGGWVTALMGGMTRGSSTNTFEVCNDFARTLGAECSYITAPIFCPSEESRDAMLGHYGLAGVMKRARECDIALVACGNMSTQSLILYHDVMHEKAAELQSMGAVGDLLGTFIGSEGQIIDHPLNGCVMALHPNDLKAIPTSILVAGGIAKFEIVRAILRGGYVNTLVTDENVAEALLL